MKRLHLFFECNVQALEVRKYDTLMDEKPNLILFCGATLRHA